MTLILIFLSLAYLSKGFYTLAIDVSPDAARDLLERWREQHYIYLRTYPYYMDSTDINPQLGEVKSGGYPPWAFFTGFFIFPNLSWPLTRFYHVLLNFLSLGVLSRFAYRLGLPFGQLPAYLFVAACLAFSSNTTTLNNGQYGIIINAFLIGVYHCIQNRKQILAGILMGIALSKPNISAPYLLGLVIQRKIKAIAVTFFYIIFSTFTIARITELDFGNVISRFLYQIQYVTDDGFSGINILMNVGINREFAIGILIAIAAVIGAMILWKLHDTPLLILFASASVIGRVLIYHRSYDDVMLVFLLLALLQQAFQCLNRYIFASVLLVGLSLWTPLSLQIKIPYWSTFQMLVWVGSLAYLMIISLVNRQERQSI